MSVRRISLITQRYQIRCGSARDRRLPATVAAAALLALGALHGAPHAGAALQTAPPRAWRHGAYVVPLEAYDPAASNLQKSSLDNKTSAYPDLTSSSSGGSKVRAGSTWPLQSAGVLAVQESATVAYPLGFYNDAWSADGDATTGQAILLKTESLANPASLRWNFATALVTSRLYVIAMGVNVFAKHKGKPIGKVTIHRQDGSSQSQELILGTHVRTFKWKSSDGMDYLADAPTEATNLYTGACQDGSKWCYLDVIAIDIAAADVAKPVSGVTVEAFRLATLIDGSSSSIYSSLRLHGLTFAADFEVSNGGSAVQTLSQGECSTGGGWGAARYGGRRLVAGGTVYGPKRNIKAIGCGLTSATMVINYHKGGSVTPALLNEQMQGASGFSPSNVGVLDGFTAQVQQACATWAATHPLDACGCCSAADCSAACGGSAPAWVGGQAARMCCAVGALTGLPAGGAPTVGAVVEVYPSGYRRSDGSWRSDSMATDLDTFSACSGPALAATPAVTSGNTPLANLEMSAAAHPFDQSGCVAMTDPAFAGIEVHPTTRLPCKRHLKLATIAALEGTPTLAAGAAVKFFQNVDWSVAAALHSLSYGTPRMALGSDDAAEALAVETLLAAGKPLILRVKDDSHFLVAKGTAAPFWTTPATMTGLTVAAPGAHVGSYRVADPGKATSANLIESMHPGQPSHRNLFSGWRPLLPGAASAALTVTIHSPAELLATAGDGKRAGWHPQAGLLLDLPGSAYGTVAADRAPDDGPPEAADLGAGPKELTLPPTALPLTLAVIGTGFGDFGLEVRHVDASAAVTGLWQAGTIRPGKVVRFTLAWGPQGPTLTPLPALDGDQDGADQPADCDDANAVIGPGAVELCASGVDEDCDGLTDAADPGCAAGLVPCADADQDGYARCDGACDAKGLVCGDCDDASAIAHPGGSEGGGLSCGNGVDDDCDGAADASAPSCAGKLGSPFGSDALAKAIAAAQAAGGVDAGPEAGGEDAGNAADVVGADGGGDSGQDSAEDSDAPTDAGDEVAGDAPAGDADEGDADQGDAGAADAGAADASALDAGGEVAGDAPAAVDAADAGAAGAGATAAVKGASGGGGCHAGPTGQPRGALAWGLLGAMGLLAALRRRSRQGG